MLHDALFLVLVVFSGVLFAEILLPGFISGYISFSKLTIATVAIIAMIGFFGRKIGIHYETGDLLKSKLSILLLVFMAAATAASLFGNGIVDSVIIFVLMMFIAYRLLKMLVGPEE